MYRQCRDITCAPAPDRGRAGARGAIISYKENRFSYDDRILSDRTMGG